jgi:hypothetical protein
VSSVSRRLRWWRRHVAQSITGTRTNSLADANTDADSDTDAHTHTDADPERRHHDHDYFGGRLTEVADCSCRDACDLCQQ